MGQVGFIHKIKFLDVIRYYAYVLYAPIIVTPHPPHAGRAEVGISGDLQELFDKFPTPGDDFMLQIP